jgi:outer membrane protein assembly factor BamB
MRRLWDRSKRRVRAPGQGKLRSVGTVMILLGLWSGYSSWAWAQGVSRLGRELLVSEAAARRAGLLRKWSSYVPVAGLQERIEATVVLEDLLVVQTGAGNTFLLETETGRMLATLPGSPTVHGQARVALNSSQIFTVKAANLYAFDRSTGVLQWRELLEQLPNTLLAANEEYVYFGTVKGRIYAYPTDPKAVGRGRWYFQTYTPLVSAPVATSDFVAIGSLDGLVYVFPPGGQRFFFRYRTDGPVVAPIGFFQASVSGQTIDALLVPCKDGFLYTLDARRGGSLWRYAAGDALEQPVMVVGQEAYLTAGIRGLHCVDLTQGEAKWWAPGVKELVSVSARKVYGRDRFGRLVVLTRDKGAVLAVLDVHEIPYAVYNPSSDRIFLISSTGLVTCLHEEGQEQPWYHRPLVGQRAPLLKPPVSPAPLAPPQKEPPKQPEMKPKGTAPTAPKETKREAT